MIAKVIDKCEDSKAKRAFCSECGTESLGHLWWCCSGERRNFILSARNSENAHEGLERIRKAGHHEESPACRISDWQIWQVLDDFPEELEMLAKTSPAPLGLAIPREVSEVLSLWSQAGRPQPAVWREQGAFLRLERKALGRDQALPEPPSWKPVDVQKFLERSLEPCADQV